MGLDGSLIEGLCDLVSDGIIDVRIAVARTFAHLCTSGKFRCRNELHLLNCVITQGGIFSQERSAKIQATLLSLAIEDSDPYVRELLRKVDLHVPGMASYPSPGSDCIDGQSGDDEQAFYIGNTSRHRKTTKETSSPKGSRSYNNEQHHSVDRIRDEDDIESLDTELSVLADIDLVEVLSSSSFRLSSRNTSSPLSGSSAVDNIVHEP